MSEDLKMKDQNKKLIVDKLKKTPIIQVVCEQMSVPRSTFYRWRKEDKVFAKKIDESLMQGNQIVNDMAESQLISSIKDRNLRAIIFWLKNHHKTYANKLELSGGIKTETEQLSSEQEKILRQAIKLAGVKDDKQGDNKDGK